jgi:dihydropyrimidinase
MMSMNFDTVLQNGTLVTASETFQADIGIKGERISAIGQSLETKGAKVFDLRGKFVIPGGIDAHTHMEFPFMSTTSADDFESGTIASACGGITTIIDFALQKPGESLEQTYKAWHKKADGKAVIDYGFHMIIRDLNPRILDEIKETIAYGIPSFKLFMTYRKEGLLLDDGAIFRVMEEVAKYNGLVGLHCENNDLIECLMSRYLQEGRKEPKYFAKSKPPVVEGEAVHRAVRLSEYAGAAMYVVHMSTRMGRETVFEAQQAHLPVYAETCPHYLVFTDEVYERPDGAHYVMSPPIKKKEDQEALWHGLASGDIKTVGSDHCCFTSEQKKLGKDDFTKIPNGVAGTEVIIPVLYSEGVLKNRIKLNQLVQVTSYNPARLFGLYPKKGTLAVGSDADIVVLDPQKEVRLTKENLHSKIDHSIYEAFTLKGYPVMTFSRGRLVYENGKFVGEKGWGKFQPRKPLKEAEQRQILVGALT